MDGSAWRCDVDDLLGRLSAMEPALDVTNPDTWPELMMLAELAAVLRVSEPTALKLVNGGLLPYIEVGSATRKTRRFRKADVLNLPTVRATPAKGTKGPAHTSSPA